ncbi:AsmA family protein [Pontibacter sp. HSC-14F20]|uniref:AsmA family protein n=1 Tax=Pontibacter sp. HSC-14F20 TaxID=2864136 RepID=UPI001C72B5AB|nr:AsmA family protein [Pontibacter sp. HSC-14F20]MBX0334211.1 AsmA family protein [Pontibacter sp. HSC-14F20]
MKTRSFVKIFLLVAGLLLMLVLAAQFLLAPLYQEKLPVFIRTTLTKDPNLVLAPFQSDISNWKNFPYLTLTLDNISLKDTSGAQPVEVLAVRHAQVLVPVLQWPFSKLRISKLYLDGLTFHQQVDSTGHKRSLSFGKEEKQDDDSGSFTLNIPQIRISNARFLSENHYKESAFSIQLLDSDLAAELSDNSLKIKGKLEGKINYISSRDLRLFEDRNFTADARYTYDLQNKLGRIEESRAVLNENEVLISGTHQKMDNGPGSELDLHFKGEQPFFFLLNQMNSVRSIPLLRQVESDGRVMLHYHIAGHSGPTERPRNKLHFALQDGKLHWPTSRITLSHIQVAGLLDNGPKHSSESSTFTLQRLSVRTGNDSLQLKAKITDFTKPYVEARISGSYTLDSLADLMPPDYLSLPRGTLAGDVTIRGNLYATEDRQREQDLQWQGAISLQGVGFQPAKLTVPFTDLNGEAKLAGNELRLQGMGGKMGGQSFSVEGSMRDVMNYLMGQQQTVTINGAIKLKQVNTAWLKLKSDPKINGQQVASTNSAVVTTTILPEFLRLNMRLVCEQLNLEEASVHNMQTRLKSNGKRLTLSDIGLTSQGITVTGNVTAPNDNRKLHAANIQLAAQMDTLDLNSLQQVNAIAGSAGGGKKTTTADKAEGMAFLTPLQKVDLLLRVKHIDLPGEEDLQHLSVRLHKNKSHVTMQSMRFKTSKGGVASAEGGFYLISSKLTRPYLNVNLQYDFLDLQAFMQNFAALKTLLPTEQPQDLAEKKTEDGISTKLREKVYDLGLHVEAQELKYDYLKGSNLEIKARMNREQAQLDKLYLHAFGGKIFSNGMMYLNEPSDTIPVRLKAQVQDVDLEQLFAVAEQMELDMLGSRNIKGKADCNIAVHTKLDGTFAPSFDRTVAYTQATFRSMELIDIKPIQEALGFMRKERTEHLFFEDVNADFVLYKNKFVAPSFSMHNNLSSFDLRGSYTMRGEASLSIDINIFNILFGNNQRRIEQIQEDSLSLNKSENRQHLLLVREQDKYKVKLSNRREREGISLVLRNEFQDVLEQYQIDTAFTEIK